MKRYWGRPTISPAIAALFAAGTIKPTHRVLDIGCGGGTDISTLASWGVRHVAGLDDSKYHPGFPDDVGRRFQRLVRNGVVEYDVFELHDDSITYRHGCFNDRSFNVVLDTLFFNTLSSQRKEHLYAKEVGRLTAPGGLLIMQWRAEIPKYGVQPAIDLPEPLRRRFKFGPVVGTDLVEAATRGGRPERLRVALAVGRRR